MYTYLTLMKSHSQPFLPIRIVQLVCLYAFTFCSICLQAQPTEKIVKVIVAPDHTDWTYKTGEKVKFSISVMQHGNPISHAKIKYEVMPEKMEVLKTETLTLT